jgi:FAD:protein FMN transferase
MKETRLIMDMPITIEITDEQVKYSDLVAIFKYFEHVDRVFSTFKKNSEISRLNRGELELEECSAEVKEVLEKCAQTEKFTAGYFNPRKSGLLDPSGLVKGWAIQNAAAQIKNKGFKNFYVDAGGDIQTQGVNSYGNTWRTGIRNPFNREEIVKVLEVSDKGIATSGTSIRGQHIYDPYNPAVPLTDVVSITVVGPNIYEADRFATAVFAMQRAGIYFLEQLPGFEGYMIDKDKKATFTSGFHKYVSN